MLCKCCGQELQEVTVIGGRGQMLLMSDGSKRYKGNDRVIKEEQDLTGMKFNDLKVLEMAVSDKQGALQWLCRCDCGNDRIVRSRSLKSGSVKNCGCTKNHKHYEKKATK